MRDDRNESPNWVFDTEMNALAHAYARLHGLGVALAVIAFAGALTAAIAADTAGGAKVTVLGAGPKARPSCTPKLCVVEAKVTGFQGRIGSIGKPFVAPFPGKIVAWSVKLGRPSAKDDDCLTRGCGSGDKRFPGFGGPAQARLAIIRKTGEDKRKRPIYKLLRQSPVEALAPYFGSTTTFTLQQPLKIGKGQVAALTIPTWAPVFAGGLGAKNVWRASRKASKRKGGCTIGKPPNQQANINAGGPHQRPGTKRRYGCRYRTNRLLYSASLVRKPG